jgi:hypothetical protein
VAYQVVEQVDAGQIWHEFDTREEAQAYYDERVAEDPLVADVLTILGTPPRADQ